MTPLQFDMLKNIARNDHTPVNGAEPKTIDDVSWVWADCVIETVQDKGVFTSLVNAGLAKHSGHKGRDACVTLTQAGFDAYKAAQARTDQIVELAAKLAKSPEPATHTRTTTTGEGRAVVTVHYSIDCDGCADVRSVDFQGVNIYDALTVETINELAMDCQAAHNKDADADALFDRTGV